MATSLRLTDDAATALRDTARRTGGSQQDLLREAVDSCLGIGGQDSPRDRAVIAGVVKAPSPSVDVVPTVVLPGGHSVLDLLDRHNDR